jgi:hypothetical protein
MDATLGARNPVASTPETPAASDTSTSPAEPLVESDAATKRLPTAEELYATPASSADGPSGTTRGAAVEKTEAADAAGTTQTDQASGAGAPTATAPTVPLTGAAPGAAGAGPSETKAGPNATVPTDATVPAAAPASAHPAPADAAQGTATAGTHAPTGRTVSDLADRLDDSRFFSSLFDFTFTNYVTRKLAGPVYVVGLVLIALGVVVGFGNALTSAIATHAPIGAFVFLFGVLITLVGAMLAVLLLRVGIEVFCAIIEIAQNTRRRRPPGE